MYVVNRKQKYLIFKIQRALLVYDKNLILTFDIDDDRFMKIKLHLL